MITKETFQELWDETLGNYFRQIDCLKELGLMFDEGDYGDLIFNQSQALNEWLVVNELNLVESILTDDQLKEAAQYTLDNCHRFEQEIIP